MTRDDVLDLIPLYAGGDLDAASTTLMDRAVEAYSDCAEVLAGYDELEALLVAEMTPEVGEEPEWVREALLASVAWTAPSVSCQTSQLSTVPNASSPASARRRASGTLSSIQASFVAEK